MAYKKTDLLENLPPDVNWRLLEMATQGIWRWDIKKDVVRWSDKLQQTLKSKSGTGDDIKLFDIMAITHPEDVEIHRKGIAEQLLKTGKYDIKIRLQTPEDTYIQCHVLGTTIFNEDNEPEIALGFVLDNTREYDLIQAIIEQNHIFTTFMDKCPGAVFLKNRQGQHIYVNDMTAQVVGKSKDEIVGKTAHELFPEPLATQLSEIDRQVFEKQNLVTWQGEVDGTIHGGEMRHVYDIKFPVNIGDDVKLLGGFGFDVTELQKSREAIANIQKLESIGRLAGGIAHDFNNMMGIIQGHTEIARLKIDDPDHVMASIQKIETAISRSSEMVHKLLGFARKQPASPQLFELNTAIEEAMALIKPLIGENIKVECQFSQQPLPLKFDHSQLIQVLTNLCLNARDAISSQGTIVIKTQEKQLSREEQRHFGLNHGKYAMITISDDGHGIEKSHLEKIFEPFYTTKPSGKGTGLGLSTVYGILKQNEGHIDAASKPGKGSSFSLYLGLSDKPVADVAEVNTVAPGKTKARVLLVEDNPELLEVTSELLWACGYEPVATASPVQALKLFTEQQDHLDILITDITMPDMSGLELIKKIRQNCQQFPVIITTGYNDNVDIELQQHANTHTLIKPVNLNTLNETLQACLKT